MYSFDTSDAMIDDDYVRLSGITKALFMDIFNLYALHQQAALELTLQWHLESDAVIAKRMILSKAP